MKWREAAPGKTESTCGEYAIYQVTRGYEAWHRLPMQRIGDLFMRSVDAKAACETFAAARAAPRAGARETTT